MAPVVPDAVIFDFDGVLVDSYGAVTGSINAALVEHGLPSRPPASLRHYIGPPTFTTFRELTGEPEGSPLIEEIIATYRRHYAAVYLEQTQPIDGVVGLLEGISQRLALAIATSKSVTFTQPLLARLALERYFCVIQAARPNDRGDDKTAIVGRAIEALAARGRSHVVMVGDRSFDIVAARAHGLVSIGVTWGIGSAQELTDAGADVLVGAPSELAELLEPERPIGR